MTKADEEREAVLDDLVAHAGDLGRRGRRALVIDPRFPSSRGAEHQPPVPEEKPDTAAGEGNGESADEPIADEEVAGDEAIDYSSEGGESPEGENGRSQDEGS